jgi:thymidylate synthase ThyX
VVEEAGLTDGYVASLERSRDLYEALASGFPEQAPYAVALAYRIRYTMQMNAREAMHLVELRSGPQGHPSYRWVAQEMHRQIAERAGHHLLAEAMSHVDYGAEDLERLESERRAEQRRNSL